MDALNKVYQAASAGKRKSKEFNDVIDKKKDFDDRLNDLDDLHEIELQDDRGELSSEDDDHLPDDDD